MVINNNNIDVSFVINILVIGIVVIVLKFQLFGTETRVHVDTPHAVHYRLGYLTYFYPSLIFAEVRWLFFACAPLFRPCSETEEEFDFPPKVLRIEIPTDHVPGPLADGVRPGFCRPDVFGVGRSSGSQDTHTADTRKLPTLSFEFYDTNSNDCCFVRSERRSAVHSVVHFWILPRWIVGSGNNGLLPASQ